MGGRLSWKGNGSEVNLDSTAMQTMWKWIRYATLAFLTGFTGWEHLLKDKLVHEPPSPPQIQQVDTHNEADCTRVILKVLAEKGLLDQDGKPTARRNRRTPTPDLFLPVFPKLGPGALLRDGEIAEPYRSMPVIPSDIQPISLSLSTTNLPYLIRSPAQAAPDCSSGCNGPNDTAWSVSQQACLDGNNTSCGIGCTCYYGFLLSVVSGKATPRWFNFSMVRGEIVMGESGPLLRHRVQKGDIVYRVNNRTPSRSSFTRYTRTRPAKYCEARWDVQGRLHLRLWR